MLLTKRWHVGLVCAVWSALLLTVLPLVARTSYAHAVVVRSEPVANAHLAAPPDEVRIWFTEPLESAYSTIELRDGMGKLVALPPSYVDPSDAHQLVLATDMLGEGLYTVVWRNVSAADGHQQRGSFPFVIGVGEATAGAALAEVVSLNPFDVLTRWVNFWGLALAVGSIAFIVLVWRPATRERLIGEPKPLLRLVWISWIAAGVGGVLVLWNQMVILLNLPILEAFTLDNSLEVIGNTRFGTLLMWRMGLWLVMGLLLLWANRSQILAWLAAMCALAMLVPISLYSHAAASDDLALSFFSDWVHLAMTGLWVGGLVALLVAIGVVRGASSHLDTSQVSGVIGAVVAHFSNLARMAVIGLIVTGIYATWHQVNTLAALTTTFYGQLLLMKLGAALLLVLIAGVNLFWTQRRLLAGQMVWVGRLRALVSLEVILAFGILFLVGAMTAISPARNVMAQREAAAAIPPAPQPQPIHMVEDVDDVQIHFTATPGWVGNSRFVIQLVNRNGDPVTNASLIRMRFEHQTEKLGESELQIRPEDEAVDGLYTTEGANLSTVGDWRLRVTVQRPDEFDSLADFEFTVMAPPPPPPAPVVESNPVLPNRTPTLRLVGMLALLAGGYALVAQRFRLSQGGVMLGGLLVVLGAAFLWSGFGG